MGFFSKLFQKKDNLRTESSVNIAAKVDLVSNVSDIPPLQGDYAKTIFLCAHSKASPVKENDSYTRYFLHECGIRNTAKYHRELIAEGYFEEASNELILNSLKTTELKEILETTEKAA